MHKAMTFFDNKENWALLYKKNYKITNKYNLHVLPGRLLVTPCENTSEEKSSYICIRALIWWIK